MSERRRAEVAAELADGIARFQRDAGLTEAQMLRVLHALDDVSGVTLLRWGFWARIAREMTPAEAIDETARMLTRDAGDRDER